MSDIAAIVGFAGLLAFFGASAMHLVGVPNGAARFERSYANANQRILDCLFWALRHAWKAFADGGVLERLARAAVAMGIGAAMVALSTYVVVQADAPPLDDQGIAVGIGALLWSCVLEGAALPERAGRVANKIIWDRPLWALALLLLIFDLLLLLVAAVGWFGTGSTGAGAVGASFVALADVTSFAFGLALAAQAEESPLGDP